ncbi:MAG TPA: hypothetical protein VGW36_00250 [Pyrinomonadaceae bacterium]|nr:hypothetical protein [Pyrinomonadaceae bacterium]
MKFKRLAIAVASIVCLLNTAGAQQPPSQPAETGLALEITFLRGVPPTYLRVSGVGSSDYAWYTRFGRIAGAQLPAGAKPIRAVKIVPYLDGDTVRISVSLLRGIKAHESEQQVSTYVARERERLTVEALRDFGIEPFEIEIVRVAPLTSGFPTIINKTPSLEVVGIEPVVSTFPAYKIMLRNVSDRNISALQVNVIAGKKRRLALRQGKEGQPLIKAGDSIELKEPLVTEALKTANGYAPATRSAQQIVFSTLVLEDGSYEGEAEEAATYRGFAVGRKTMLTRIVPVLDSALGMSSTSEELRKQLRALSDEVDDTDVDALAVTFPGIDRQRLKSPIDIAVISVRRELLRELKLFEKTQSSNQDFQIWLKGIRDRYSNWLSRLSPNDFAHR